MEKGDFMNSNNYNEDDFILNYQKKRNELLWDFHKKYTTLQADEARERIRLAHPNKTDEELGIDQPFLNEQYITYAEQDCHKIQNFFVISEIN